MRTGRVIEGVIYTDEEYKTCKKEAAKRQQLTHQQLHEGFKELGFDPSGLGTEQDEKQKKEKTRKKTSGELAMEGRSAEGAGDESPYAHSLSERMRCIKVYFCITVYLAEGRGYDYDYDVSSALTSSSMSVAALQPEPPPGKYVQTSFFAMGKGKKKGKRDKGNKGSYDLHGGCAFDRGMAAWQIFSQQE